MSSRQGRLQEGRDTLPRTQRLANELFDYQPSPGVVYFPAAESMAAFTCIGVDANEACITARADGSILAVGVLAAAVALRDTAKVRTCGRVDDAISGGAANAPVYVADDGSLTLVAPGGASYVQQVGVCVNATDIFVDIQAPVF